MVDMLAEGMSKQMIMGAYPVLEIEDIHDALHFAAEAIVEDQDCRLLKGRGGP